jgi:predicted nuclease with RNAse H fold/dephospho-CoA kinase
MAKKQKRKRTAKHTIRPIPPKLRDELALCNHAPDRVLFLDIETTGLSHFYDEITIVGWSFKGKHSTLIKGQPNDCLLKDMADANALVTFNGIRFDAKFLAKEYPDITLPPVHIDLMYLCRRVGLTGGQKSIEDQLRLNFRDSIAGVDGFAAVLLWHRYLRGEKSALKQLIHYNRADIAAMGAIFDHAQSLLNIEPDLFSKPIRMEDWSAPEGWQKIPKLPKSPPEELIATPDFEELFGQSDATTKNIVGIDLTGSELRGTGWALLTADTTEVQTLSTDEDIINATMSVNPDLVSIDSPLCLPAGRMSVDDSDPGREQYGIMRECERELKRRGVNVYPSLLPSMQKLTARGIRIAEELRKKGVPVIESYPGAAQDIMRIPRKGAGIEWLKLGLQNFGIKGDYTQTEVSHDELDAITSALVGTFHLAGLSESLGTDKEPPLIVPKLDAKPQPIVIGISGPIAAGKTTIGETLKDRGFSYTRFSLAIDHILEEQGFECNRANRQKLGEQINDAGQQYNLAERTITLVDGASRIVVDGLRFPEDHAFFVEKFGLSFIHIHVKADEHIRRLRYSAKNSNKSFDDASKSTVEHKVGGLKGLCHEVFVNDGQKQDIEEYVDILIDNHVKGRLLCQSQ